MIQYPPLPAVEQHRTRVKAALRAAGLPAVTIGSIETKALRTGRKLTGPHKTNRQFRWAIPADHPQYGAEHDCKIILVKLCAQLYMFDNAPDLDPTLKKILEDHYLGEEIMAGKYRDRLLLEHFDFNDLIQEGLNPVHGHSSFHLGHEDPTLTPKHQPSNVGWRTLRSNLIQGDMTLRQARVYFIKLIGRYFELGEIEVN